ncbi:WxL protein peptidoglycan domain-containing protein [Isoptericola croceus]|uniref:WxL protein peptidoglycan domain-containing protein n=1 Tax=Isoptericola croceus TaxID=3031406 RepID=UPI0023F9B5BB|nr:DUF916 domain-containing protein [Isoptericola croceus]
MISRSLLAVAVAGGVALLAPMAPDEPSEGSDQISWSVVPADDEGPDGRRVVDVELGPGKGEVEHVAVANHGDEPVTFALRANDGYLTANGSFDMLPSDTEPTDGGSWISVPAEVTVPGGEAVVVPVEIAVPEHATPGDHPAGVAASIVSSDDQVLVEHRVGVRVNLRVPGDVVAALDVPQVTTSFEPSWNPFAPGTLDVTVDVANAGNVRLDAVAEVSAEALAVDARGAETVGEMLGGGGRQVSVSVGQVWPVGPVTTTVTVVPEPIGDAAPADLSPVSTTVTAWAVPVPQLLLAALLALVLLAERDRRRRARARLEAQLARARAQGAAEARAAS